MFPWARFFLYVLVTAGTPGPNTLSSMSNGSRLGFRRTLPYIFGIWTGFPSSPSPARCCAAPWRL